MKKAFAFNYVIYGIVYLAIFIFVGVFNLAFAQWNMAALQSANYWFQTLSTSLTYIVSYQVAVNLSADIYTQTYPQYVSTQEEVEKTVKTSLGPDFRTFITDYNFRSKRSIWETKISNKLTKLQNHTRQRVFDEMRLKPKEEWSTLTNTYLRKKAALEEQLTDEWILKNLPYIKLTYPQISQHEVATGEIKPYNKSKVIDNNVATYGLLKKVLILLGTIAINAIFTAMILTGSPFTAAVAIQLIFQILIIAINIVSGFFTGVEAFKKKRLNSLYKRREILIEYLSVKAKPQSTVDKPPQQI